MHTHVNRPLRTVPHNERDVAADLAPTVARVQCDWVTRFLLAFGIVAPMVTVTAITVMAARTAGYSHVSDAVSDLAAQGVPDAGFILPPSSRLAS
jgi:hypothetical protein